MWRYGLLFFVLLPLVLTVAGVFLVKFRDRFPWYRERAIHELEEENAYLDNMIERELDKARRVYERQISERKRSEGRA